MKEMQTNRFNEQVGEILDSSFGTTLNWNAEKCIVDQAKVNTTATLSPVQVNALDYMADSWDFSTIEISRSGAGLKIEFKDHITTLVEEAKERIES